MGLIVTPMVTLIDIADLVTLNFIDGATLRLFSNNYTPVPGSAIGNFTQCTFTGYAGIVLPAGGAAFDNGAGFAEVDYALQTFICTGGGGQNIYGWYVDNAGVVVAAQRDPGAPFAITPGFTYSVLIPYLVGPE